MNELLALLSGDHHLFQGHLSQGRTAGQDGDQGGKGQPRTGRVESCLTLHSVFSLIVMRRSRAEHPPLPTTSAGGLTPARPRRFNVVPTTMPASPGTRPFASHDIGTGCWPIGTESMAAPGAAGFSAGAARSPGLGLPDRRGFQRPL